MGELILKGIIKRFGKIIAVKDLGLEVKEGEFIVIVGPSGCGKSTILRLIAGLEEPTQGEIYLDGRLLNPIPPKDRDVAMVFQSYALYPHMKVFDNIAFPLRVRGYPKREIRGRVEEVSGILGILGLLDRYPRELSGGERQRVALGRAIVRNPKVFLFDEPLSNLDAKLRVQMRAEILSLHKRLKSTVIYVTHDQAEAMTMGDRIVVLKDGVIQQIADPVTLYEKPDNLFVAGFIGTPPMNLFKGIITRDLFFEGGIRVKLPEDFIKYKGKRITLGIRPEDISIGKGGVWGKVELVENLGNLLYIHIRIGKEMVVVQGKRVYSTGERVRVDFDFKNVHLFDERGRRVEVIM